MKTINDLKPSLLLFVLLTILSGGVSAHPDEPKKGLGVFIDGRQLSIDTDSLSLTAKGNLTIRYSDGTPLKTPMTFRVLIRHRNYAGNVLLFPWDEEYKTTKSADGLELPDILKKMKHGDQLVLMPLSAPQGSPIVITISADSC